MVPLKNGLRHDNSVFDMMFEANGCFKVMLLRCLCSTAHIMAAACFDIMFDADGHPKVDHEMIGAVLSADLQAASFLEGHCCITGRSMCNL